MNLITIRNNAKEIAKQANLLAESIDHILGRTATVGTPPVAVKRAYKRKIAGGKNIDPVRAAAIKGHLRSVLVDESINKFAKRSRVNPVTIMSLLKSQGSMRTETASKLEMALAENK